MQKKTSYFARVFCFVALVLSLCAAQAQTATTTTLTSSVNPSADEQGVTFTATVTGNNPTGNVTFKNGTNNLSTKSLSGGVATYSTSNLAIGSHNITAVYNGNATNTASTSDILVQVVNPPPTTTALTSSVNPSTYGQNITLTATVSGSGPTGTVTFKDGVDVLGVAALTGTLNRTAKLGVSSLSAASHTITAIYGGDAGNATSTSSALTQVVNRAGTTTTLAISPSPGIFGQTITVSGTVTGRSPSGAVNIMEGAATLGSTTISGSGTFSLSLAAPGVGTHNITAAYAGDSNNLPSTSAAVAEVINKAATTTALSSSANPSAYGDTVTISATVSGQSPGGIVTFRDGNNVVGTGTLTLGAASVTLGSSALDVKTHSLTGVYGGDASNAASTSTALSQVVTKATPIVTVSSSANPSQVSQTVTLTATVIGQAPSGTFTFKDGATTLGTANIGGHSGDTRTATFATSALALGSSHSITVVYGGDAENMAVTSPAITQVVGPSSTVVALSSSANPSPYSQSITLTATVTGLAPGGVVTFKDGATTLGTGTLSGGGDSPTAALAISTLAGGTHGLTATYGGDGTNPAGISVTVTQTITALPTTTALSSDLSSSAYGQTVTWTATVSGGGNIGGVMAFKDATAVFGTATVTAGAATFSSNALGAGIAHTITAVYAGDGNYATSTSTGLSHTVSKTASSVALSTSPNPSVAGQNMTMTATITGFNPTGVVTFKNGTTVLGTATAGTGTSRFGFHDFGVGSYSLSAEYSGDANHVGSAGAAVHTINTTGTTTTLTVTPNPASLGQNVTLVARVSGYKPGGTVTFAEGGTPLGTAPASGGAATLSLSSLGTGTHTLSASYSGDANNNASNANTASLIVNARTGFTWQYGYDAMGRPNTVVDPNGLATYTYYDGLGRPIQSQQPANVGSSNPTIIQFGWDLQDSLTRVVDPRVLTTTYSVNGLGDTLVQSSPDSGSTTATYDLKGNLTASTDARGKQTTYGYDVLDRLTSIGYPTGVGTTFEYDGGAAPSLIEKGFLTKMTDESGQTAYTHDGLGRLITKSVTIGSKTFTIGYGWGDSGTALDQLTAITYPSGSRVNYGYDDKGYVNAISLTHVNAGGSGLSATITTVLGSVTYNADNNPTGWQWSDGKARAIGYDGVGMINSYTLGDPQGTGNTAGVLRSVARDNAGRIGGYTHTGSGAAGLDQSFGYDNLNRLITATIGSTSTSYEYDDTGNRKSKTIGGTAYVNTIANNSNRLTQIQDVNCAVSVSYDAAGHITADCTNTYTYNDRGRMSSATVPSGAVNFKYNGLNQRVSKSGTAVPGGTVYYVYDEAGQLLGEYDGNAAPVYETIYLGSMPVGVHKTTGSAGSSTLAVSIFNVHSDHIDTPRVITGQDHTMTWRWDTAEAFGATAPNQDPSALGAFLFNQRFPGQVFDSETGLFQNWNREYNARLGRYAQSDPIGLARGINTFSYVDGDPLSKIDPTGEFGIAGAVGGAAVNAAIQFGLNYYAGGGSAADAAKCVDFRKVITSAALGAAGPTVLGNKVIPVLASQFGKKVGVEFGMKPIAATMGTGVLLNTLTGMSESPPLHFFGADECECKNIRDNIKKKLGNMGHAISGIFF